MDLYTFPPEVGSNALLLPSATAPMIATPYDENHLVVGPLDSGDHDYKHYYWLYKVESNSWTVCPESPSLFQSVGSPVKVGNTLYYRCGSTSDYIDGDICALDLESGIYYRGPVRWKAINHKVVTVNSGEHALFHLGGNDFCYCTIHKHSHVFCPDYPHTTSICCTKVRLVKRNDRLAGYLDATITSSLSIPVANYVERIIDTCNSSVRILSFSFLFFFFLN